METKNVVTKKIMFNDNYGLTQAVLESRKTMTRRIIHLTDVDKTYLDTAFDWDIRERVIIDRYAKYKVGEVVAVAQSYKSVFKESLSYSIPRWHWLDDHIGEKGFDNKMFVKASEMPHQIQITGIKIERLQDISEEDCLREGLQEYFPYPNVKVRTFQYFKRGIVRKRISPASRCFAYLIDDISGKGTWLSNPFVFVYSFKLIK